MQIWMSKCIMLSQQNTMVAFETMTLESSMMQLLHPKKQRKLKKFERGEGRSEKEIAYLESILWNYCRNTQRNQIVLFSWPTCHWFAKRCTWSEAPIVVQQDNGSARAGSLLTLETSATFCAQRNSDNFKRNSYRFAGKTPISNNQQQVIRCLSSERQRISHSPNNCQVVVEAQNAHRVPSRKWTAPLTSEVQKYLNETSGLIPMRLLSTLFWEMSLQVMKRGRVAAASAVPEVKRKQHENKSPSGEVHAIRNSWVLPLTGPLLFPFRKI